MPNKSIFVIFDLMFRLLSNGFTCFGQEKVMEFDCAFGAGTLLCDNKMAAAANSLFKFPWLAQTYRVVIMILQTKPSWIPNCNFSRLDAVASGSIGDLLFSMLQLNVDQEGRIPEDDDNGDL